MPEEVSNQRIEAWMFRVDGEFIALILGLVLTIVLAFIIPELVPLIDPLVVLVVLGIILAFIWLIQAQFLGNAMRVHEKQFPELFAIFKEQVNFVLILTRLQVGS